MARSSRAIFDSYAEWCLTHTGQRTVSPPVIDQVLHLCLTYRPPLHIRYDQRMPAAHLTDLAAEQWLSSGRLEIYLSATRNDLDRALALYDWNSRVTAACLQDIGHLEVLIRNRYDAELLNYSANWSSETDLLWEQETGFESARLVQRGSNNYSKKSLREALKHAPVKTHGHIVAELTFGFWTALTRKERAATVWTPILSSVFPGNDRGVIHDRMVRLNTFRNRLAHWEPVFSRTTGLPKQLGEVNAVFISLSPDVSKWVGARSSVNMLLGSCPEAGLISRPRGYLGV